VIDRCKRGHLFHEKNTYFRHRNGKTYRTCRKCESARRRFRYEFNAEWREKHKATELKRYYDNKEYPL
jgi:hypothetical protein